MDLSALGWLAKLRPQDLRGLAQLDPSQARPEMPGYRPSDNLEDRRRMFAPLYPGSGNALGSPSAKLALDQMQGLTRDSSAAADYYQQMARYWLDSNIRGGEEPFIELGPSLSPADVELRQAVAAALAGRR